MPRRRRQSFVYRPPTRVEIERIRMRLGWKDAVYQAYKGDAVALCKYLKSDLELDETKRHEISELIARRIQRRPGRGRRPGRIPSPQAEIQQLLLAVARHRLRQLRIANGGRAPRGSYRAVLEQVGADLAEDGYRNIDIDQALAFLQREARPRSRS
jgi:hypothetical protein